MPSTATITSFYTFVANTRAKAAEVNNNFSVFRGHLLPIEPLTATTSHLTYDLGSSDHAWRVGYLQKLNIRAATTTAAFIIQGNTSVTAGAADFLFDTTTIASFDLNGMKRQSLESAANRMTTTAASTANFVYSMSASAWFDVTNMSVSIEVKKSLVEISLLNDDATSTASYLKVDTVNLGDTPSCDLRLVRDTTTSIVNGGAQRFGTNLTSSSLTIAPSSVRWIDNPGPGTYTYKLQASPGPGNNSRIEAYYIKMRVREL